MILKPNCSLVDCIESSPVIFHTIHLGTVKFEICSRYGLKFELTERYLMWFRAKYSLDSVSRLIVNIFTTVILLVNSDQVGNVLGFSCGPHEPPLFLKSNESFKGVC